MSGRSLAPMPWAGFLGRRWRSSRERAPRGFPRMYRLTTSHTMVRLSSSISRNIQYCNRSRADAVLPVRWSMRPRRGTVAVKVRTSLKACVSRRNQFVMFIAILSLRYGAQYLAVLTHVCYINPYIILSRCGADAAFLALHGTRAH